MKAVVLAAVLYALLHCVSATPETESRPNAIFGNCTGFRGGEIQVMNVSISGCPEPPCVLNRGTNASIVIQLEPKVWEATITNRVYGVYRGVKIPFPLPQPDGCKLGLKCPMPPGKMQKENITMPVEKSYPLTKSLDVEWDLMDGSGKQGCFTLKIAIQ